MKKTLYILCMVMFCLADATAQQASHRLQMPMPGIDMSQTHGKRHADTKKQPAEKPQALYARGCNVRIVKPQQTASPLKAEAMTKKTLLTGMETIYEDAEEPTQSYRNNGTVETLVSIMHYNGGMLREKETRSVLEARIIFMNAAATLAIDNASDEEICGLEPYVDALHTCTDPEEASSLIFKFSHEISYISGNSLLPLFFISFKDLVCNLWVRFSRAYGVPALYQSAYDIYHFLLARDKEGAVNYITSTTQESINGGRTFYQVH